MGHEGAVPLARTGSVDLRRINAFFIEIIEPSRIIQQTNGILLQSKYKMGR